MRITARKPYSPGEILRDEFLDPLKITQGELAKAMGVTRAMINEIINGKRGITSETAIMLSKVFKTTPQFWLNVQMAVDLWESFHDPRNKSRFKRVMTVEDIKKSAA